MEYFAIIAPNAERLTSNQKAVSSSLTGRTFAVVAPNVEHRLAKSRAVSSSLVYCTMDVWMSGYSLQSAKLATSVRIALRPL